LVFRLCPNDGGSLDQQRGRDEWGLLLVLFSAEISALLSVFSWLFIKSSVQCLLRDDLLYGILLWNRPDEAQLFVLKE
jgi:hypothetical protein